MDPNRHHAMRHASILFPLRQFIERRMRENSTKGKMEIRRKERVTDWSHLAGLM